MSSNPIPRASIHASQHPMVDSLLKSLKLVTRRLQTALKINEAELLILQRLFYKNKNQHRSALFWRNVSEIRRYSQCVASLELLNNLQSLRLTFHGSATMAVSNAQPPSRLSVKGSWTCLPSRKHILNISAQLDMAHKLIEKMFGVCLRAYMSFTRSLQSGAFLSLLLTLVAITSRLKTVSLELKDVCDQSASCISGFLAFHKNLSTPSEDVTVAGIPNADPVSSDNVATNILEVVQSLALNATSQPLGFVDTQALKATVILEKRTHETKGRAQPIEPIQPKKKKRKVTKNEIDDIFGA